MTIHALDILSANLELYLVIRKPAYGELYIAETEYPTLTSRKAAIDAALGDDDVVTVIRASASGLQDISEEIAEEGFAQMVADGDDSDFIEQNSFIQRHLKGLSDRIAESESDRADEAAHVRVLSSPRLMGRL